MEPQETVLAAVSGGADSLCLLLVLKELGFSVPAAHFDHGLRPESARDAETVARIARKLGIDFHVERGDVRRWAKQKRMTLEEAARDLRYDFLCADRGRLPSARRSRSAIPRTIRRKLF